MIDWGPRGNPAFAMPDLGARLDDLVLAHPDPAQVRALHASSICDYPLRVVEGPKVRFEARIATSGGIRTLT